MNKDFYDSLTQEQQTIIDEAAADLLRRKEIGLDDTRVNRQTGRGKG